MTCTVGFLGLGVMGTLIARRILDAGFPLTVWNRTPCKTITLRNAGANIASSPAEVAETSDILAICVTDYQAVYSVALGHAGLHSATGRAQLVVDHSSIPADATCQIADKLFAANGISWLDAPVSGGTPAAQQGTLTVMAGGKPTDFTRAELVLRSYTRQRTLMGPLGAGQSTKLCNQIIVAAHTWGIAEAAILARASGIPPGNLLHGLAGGFADSTLLRHFLPQMLYPHDRALGSLNDLVKDLDTALTASRRTGAALPLTAHLTELLRIANKWTDPRIAGSFIGLLHGPTNEETKDISS